MTVLRLLSEKRVAAREAGMDEGFINSPAFLKNFQEWLAERANAIAAGVDQDFIESPEFLKYFREIL